ncbi:MAG: hypothetical protein CMP10_19660 [Zetaproteobacteria bacterium]|nr:hypothetical protein [Pseudobdellovibrionaceae bacterium]
MKKLILTIQWLEWIRIKNRIWMLIFILLGFSMFAGSCEQQNVNFNFSYSSSESTNQPQPSASSPGIIATQPNTLSDKPQENIYSQLMSLLPLVFWTFAALFLGILVLATMPFRGREEWENGQFQLIFMGKYNQIQIQGARFIAYFAITIAFFMAVSINANFLALQKEWLTRETIINFQVLLTYWFFIAVPLMISYGGLISAINIAYYRDGDHKILTLLKYLGSMGLISLLIKAIQFLTNKEMSLFQPTVLNFEVNAQAIPIMIYWELLFIAATICAAFIYWSGKILEEVES